MNGLLTCHNDAYSVHLEHMENQTIRKTFQYKLQPTHEQAAMLEQTLRLCRVLSNGALEQRRSWWGRGQGRAATHAQPEAVLTELKAVFLEYQQVHSQVLQDVLTRLDRAYQAYFPSMQAGQTPGYSRFHGPDR